MKKRIALIQSVEELVVEDAQILKDVCLIPILMKEKYDFEATIISYGINEEKLKKYFQGITCINVKNTGNYLEDINDYLEENAKNIDIFFAFGPYKSYDIITKLYKMYNPKGKIYLKLDMNRYWLERIINEEYFKNLLKISDLITAEDRKIQNLINNIYNCEIEYLRNGCYEFVKVLPVSYEEKKNVILNVGRLGTEQKRTDILIKAFLKTNLPNWELHLVGSIEKSFLPVLEELKNNPKFVSQVKVLGRIEDKNILYDEYRKAKVFCMTSQLEGCAHVYLEAGLNGCYIVSTDVDGISDIKDYSSIVPINDFNAVAMAMEKAASNEELMKETCYKVQEYTRNEGMWDNIIGRLYLLFCVKGLMGEEERDSKKISKNQISNIPVLAERIKGLKEKLDNDNDYNNIVDLSGQIIEYLRKMIIIINNNSKCILDISIKNETILLREYFMNYINGIFNGKEYIIKKYKRNIDNEYENWNEKLSSSILYDFNDYDDLEKSLRDIYSIFEYIKNNSVEDIVFKLSNMYNISPNKLANMPMGGYGKGHTSGAYYFTLKDMKENSKDYIWLYEKLQDDESRRVLTNLLRYRLTCAMQFVKNAYDESNVQYFDKKIIKCSDDEVFVDCGGFIGDTAEMYIKLYSKYKKIYIYEPSPENIEKCLENVSKYENIICRQAGVGAERSKNAFSKTGSSSSAVNIDGDTDIVELVSIDEDIQEKITFLKMDVEGKEIDALNGAKNHILNDKPKLAICVYHIVSDLWEIPKLISSIDPNYKLYLRQYREDQAWETVIYAIH